MRQNNFLVTSWIQNITAKIWEQGQLKRYSLHVRFCIAIGSIDKVLNSQMNFTISYHRKFSYRTTGTFDVVEDLISLYRICQVKSQHKIASENESSQPFVWSELALKFPDRWILQKNSNAISRSTRFGWRYSVQSTFLNFWTVITFFRQNQIEPG